MNAIEVEGYVRDPSPVTDRWAYDRHPNVEGCHVVIVDELKRSGPYLEWQLDPWHRPCRWTVDSQHHTCKQPSVVRLNRGRYGRPTGQLWYSYCAEHTYGRVWNGTQLLTTILVRDAA